MKQLPSCYKQLNCVAESRSVIEKLNHPLFNKKGVSVFVKRDDLIHPIISGNKWRKLKYNIAELPKGSRVISFGGSYSNHIHALAFACSQANIKCIGIIRGEEQNQNNFTLSCARHWGMDLNFVDRSTYRKRHEVSYLAELKTQYPSSIIIPEGGTNRKALFGVAELVSEASKQIEFDTLMTPVGSGGTLSGLALGDNNKHKLIGISVLKGAKYLDDEVTKLLAGHNCKYKNWKILHDYHCGGYAKFKPEHLTVMIDFQKTTGLAIEPVYSGKMIVALMDLLSKNYFKVGERILLLHTGGLQGLHGLAERNLIDTEQWQLPTLK